MSNFSLSSNSTPRRFFKFDVDVVNGEVCLHLFVTRGKKNCLKFFRVCLHAVSFEPVNGNFSHTY